MHSTEAVTLDTCDREPIHIPGAVQPHGALLAFRGDGTLETWSANAPRMLGASLTSGMPASGLPASLGAHVRDELNALIAGDSPHQGEIVLDAGAFDTISHASSDGTFVMEFEEQMRHAAASESFAIRAHRSLDHLRRQKTIAALLESAVLHVRDLTGFDRVMAYRFRHDASGDIVAEARRADLEPLVGRRYPASDIPVQARRMYVANTIRLIADVKSTPAPLFGRRAAPLDMTHCVLRAVSPIHIEYLGNMGVGASMSVSIVVNGNLWGMLACHHLQAHRVPYAVRMTCDVLAQLLASSVQGLLASERSAFVQSAAALRTRMAGVVMREDDPVAALHPLVVELATSFRATAAFVSHGASLRPHGNLEASQCAAITAWLETTAPGGFAAHSATAELPIELRAQLGHYCGLLAVRFDPAQAGWIVLLRPEQVETVDWGGKPIKEYRHGPLGPRLTPRGSFELWREIVRDTAEPWSPNELEVARLLADELARAFSVRASELARAKDRLLAVLGHDLRNPLQTIAMSAQVLSRGHRVQDMGSRIQSASSRMERLISQVLDFSQLQSGMGLGFNRRPVDVAALVAELVSDERLSWSGTSYELTGESQLVAEVDPDRMAQFVGNLLTNARQHGKSGHPIRVEVRQDAGSFCISVANAADPIPEAKADQLFVPFKRESMQNRSNPGGMGLGLYIASEIARGHGGHLTYRHEGAHAVFRACLPLAVSQAAQPSN